MPPAQDGGLDLHLSMEGTASCPHPNLPANLPSGMAGHERAGHKRLFPTDTLKAIPKAKMEEVALKTLLYMDLGGLPALRDKEFHSPMETC